MPVSVKSILEGKGRNVVTATPSTTFAEAAQMLSQNHIGALVVVGSENKIAGIFTERDVVHAIARSGKDCLDQPLETMMTASVHRCDEETTVDELIELMTQRRFRHVPVENDGKLSGIISIGDVVKSRMREIELESEQIKAYIAS